MCNHSSLTRREWLGLGAGMAAGLVVLPRTLQALTRRTAPIDNLDVALKAARWIRRSRVETKNGVAWPADPLRPDSISTDLYNGYPGVILFHLELFHATGEQRWLDEAMLGANDLIERLPAMDAAKDAGLYTGLAGV